MGDFERLARLEGRDHTSNYIGHGCLNGTFYFPEELIPEVLLHLPVKHLLRIRCVCKLWCSLIDSTSFIKRHLQRNTECNPDARVIIRSYARGDNFFLGDVHSLCDSPVVEIDDPVKTFLSGAEFIDSCNGLVCLLRNNNYILLWNPATRKCRELPSPTNIPLPIRPVERYIIGFGYDQVNDDYKVVRFADTRIWGMMVTVYSLKFNSWTQAETILNGICIYAKRRGMYVNGSLYWLAKKDSHIIFAFDLGVERHRELPFPVYNNENDQIADKGLIVFNKCLRIIGYDSDYRLDTWLMNDNGVGNAWSIVLSVEQQGTQGSFSIVWHGDHFSKNRDDFLIMVDEDRLMRYDHEKNEVKNVTVQGAPRFFEMFVYTEM
ncbi:F-box protein CPR1-like [Apium graveolens]|uniref:F-box protein CPR1-like n=1 Tax=Apium graveolens TaxID=4045 RepID=UPI003D794430